MYNGMSSNVLQQQQRQEQAQQQQQQLQLVQEYKSTARKRILIVNHEYDVSFALKLVLEEEGQVLYNKMNCFQADSLNDSILALNNFEKGLYDLLIIAVVMPKMNGFELAKEIKKIDDKVKICFIIAGEIPSKVRFDVAASSSSSSVQGEGEGGGYLDKFIRLPIENKDLIEQIGRITHS
jgi:CheY-like chemotaxis protein